MQQYIAQLLASITELVIDVRYWKKKKARRKFEKENNHPKKFMTNQLTKNFMILLSIGILGIISRTFYLVKYGHKKSAIEKLAEIEQILTEEKKFIGLFPKNLNEIIRNNPLRKNINLDAWGNEYYYEQRENGMSYFLKSKGKDGILNTEDDVVGKNNLP